MKLILLAALLLSATPSAHAGYEYSCGAMDRFGYSYPPFDFDNPSYGARYPTHQQAYNAAMKLCRKESPRPSTCRVSCIRFD